MTTQTTNGITVTVETFYQQDYSNPLQREFMFAYRITIKSKRGTKVQLMERHWRIFDASAVQVGDKNPKAPIQYDDVDIIKRIVRKQLTDIRCFSGVKKHYREVQGEGVIGQTPVIKAFEEFEYVSGCNLHSETGYMYGTYKFYDLDTKEIFEVQVPRFELIATYLYN